MSHPAAVLLSCPSPVSQGQQAGEHHSKFPRPRFSFIYNRSEKSFLAFSVFAMDSKDTSWRSYGGPNIPHPASTQTPEKLQQRKIPAVVLHCWSPYLPQHRPLLSHTDHATRAQDMVPPALSALTMTCVTVAGLFIGQTWGPVQIS